VPEAFRRPAVWQISFSVLGSLAFAAAVDVSPEGYAVAILVGVLLGYLAPYWVRAVNP
jgi:hypothetical protein